MILKAVNFVSGLYILSYNFSSSAPLEPTNEILTSPDLKLRVQNEISEAIELLKDVKSIDSEKRFELMGFIKELAKRAILFERKADDLLRKQGALENQKDTLQQKINELIFPLIVAYWGVKIEINCRSVTFTVPPEAVKGLNPQEKNSIELKHKWIAIPKTCTEERKTYFKNKHNIQGDVDPETDETWKSKYENFLDDFAAAVVQAIEFRNQLGHHEFECGKIYALKKFPKPVDEYLTIFYNSLLGHITDETPETVKPEAEHPN